MECKKCKKEIEPGFKVCPYCGERLAQFKSVFEISEDVTEEELDDVVNDLGDTNNIPINDAATVVIPAEHYSNDSLHEYIVDRAELVDENNEPVLENDSLQPSEILDSDQIAVDKSELKEDLESSSLLEENALSGVDNPNLLDQEQFGQEISEPSDELVDKFISSDQSSHNELLDGIDMLSFNETRSSDGIIQDVNLSDKSIADTFADETDNKNINAKVEEYDNYNKKVFLVVKIAMIGIFIGLISFAAFRFIDIDNGHKEDNVLDDTLIIDGLNMGTYYEAKNGEKLDYVSKLTFNEDKTFLLLANTCESITELSGNYVVEDDKVILTLNDFDDNGDLINTKLIFHIVDDYQIWLENDYFCVTNAANDGIFIYRK